MARLELLERLGLLGLLEIEPAGRTAAAVHPAAVSVPRTNHRKR